VAAVAAVNTSLAAAAGAISALVTNILLNSRKFTDVGFDLPKTTNGALTGLAAITGCCALVEPWAAMAIGMMAGWVYLASSHYLVRFGIDDAVDAIPVHLMGGIVGLLSLGFFASTNKMDAAFKNTTNVGFFYSVGNGSLNATLLANEMLAILFIVGWCIGLMVPFFRLLQYIGCLRSDTLEEIAGLDAAYQVAVQEDNDELKAKIQEEFKEHKKKEEKLNRSLHSTHIDVLEVPSSSLYSNSIHRSRKDSTRDSLEENDGIDDEVGKSGLHV